MSDYKPGDRVITPVGPGHVHNLWLNEYRQPRVRVFLDTPIMDTGGKGHPSVIYSERDLSPETLAPEPAPGFVPTIVSTIPEFMQAFLATEENRYLKALLATVMLDHGFNFVAADRTAIEKNLGARVTIELMIPTDAVRVTVTPPPDEEADRG